MATQNDGNLNGETSKYMTFKAIFRDSCIE